MNSEVEQNCVNSLEDVEAAEQYKNEANEYFKSKLLFTLEAA